MKRKYEFTEIDHISINTKNLKKSIEFYKDFLQLTKVDRPQGIFPFKGEWFELPNGQQLHIVEKQEEQGTKYRGRVFFADKAPPDGHYALRTKNSDDYRDIFTEAMEKNNKAGKIAIPLHIEPFEKWQSYLLDPDNNIVEILHYYFHKKEYAHIKSPLEEFVWK